MSYSAVILWPCVTYDAVLAPVALCKCALGRRDGNTASFQPLLWQHQLSCGLVKPLMRSSNVAGVFCFSFHSPITGTPSFLTHNFTFGGSQLTFSSHEHRSQHTLNRNKILYEFLHHFETTLQKLRSTLSYSLSWKRNSHCPVLFVFCNPSPGPIFLSTATLATLIFHVTHAEFCILFTFGLWVAGKPPEPHSYLLRFPVVKTLHQSHNIVFNRRRCSCLGFLSLWGFTNIFLPHKLGKE